MLLLQWWVRGGEVIKVLKNDKNTMQSVQINSYQKGQVRVALREIDIPEVGNRDVLVKMHAAGVNPIDIMIAHGDVKLITPYHSP